MREPGDGLRRRIIDKGRSTPEQVFWPARQCRCLLGQVAEKTVDGDGKLLGRDVPGRRHYCPVPGEACGMNLPHVLDRQRRNGFGGSLQRPCIGVIAELKPPHLKRGDLLRILFNIGDDRKHLPAHPLKRFLVEARLSQGQAEQLDRLVPVFREELRRHRHCLGVGPEPIDRRQLLLPLQECDGVEIARTLVQEPGHEICGADLVLGLDAGAAPEPDFKRGERNRMILDKPGRDSARSGDFLNVRRRRGGARDGKRRCEQEHREPVRCVLYKGAHSRDRGLNDHRGLEPRMVGGG